MRNSVETTLAFLDSKWKLPIICNLLLGPKRFGELQRSVGAISKKVLSENLRSMEGDGLLTRRAYTEIPPRVEYRLTEVGYSFIPVIDSLCKWKESGKIVQ